LKLYCIRVQLGGILAIYLVGKFLVAPQGTIVVVGLFKLVKIPQFFMATTLINKEGASF